MGIRKRDSVLTLFSKRSVIRCFQFHHEFSKRIGNPGPEYGQYEDTQTDGPAFRVFPDRYPQVSEETLHVNGNPLQVRHPCRSNISLPLNQAKTAFC